MGTNARRQNPAIPAKPNAIKGFLTAKSLLLAETPG
jgi:hypothetical protein